MNLWASSDPERKHINNPMFYTYYQQLSTMIAIKPIITKELTDLYKTKIKFMANMHQVNIKTHGVKKQDWFIGSYRME